MGKKLTSVRINEELLKLAKDLNLNMSFLLELAILRSSRARGVDISKYVEKLVSTKTRRKISFYDLYEVKRLEQGKEKRGINRYISNA